MGSPIQVVDHRHPIPNRAALLAGRHGPTGNTLGRLELALVVVEHVGLQRHGVRGLSEEHARGDVDLARRRAKW